MCVVNYTKCSTSSVHLSYSCYNTTCAHKVVATLCMLLHPLSVKKVVKRRRDGSHSFHVSQNSWDSPGISAHVLVESTNVLRSLTQGLRLDLQ